MKCENQNQSLALYAAFKSKDTRFDGRFFVGISSTGIYCRPVCRAKLPKPENCSYYDTAAAAEQAGYRPCLLCRPELAPGNTMIDATVSLAKQGAKLLEAECDSEHNIEGIAERLGCTGRHFRRSFASEYGVSPMQYLQTYRLLLAKNLLTDTKLSILDVAMAAGFGSLRRFNDLFKKQYRLAPTALRKQTASESVQQSNFTVTLGYRPPYRWRQMLSFLSAYAIAGVELVRNDEYLRTVHLVTSGQQVYGWIKVRNQAKKNVLTVTLDSALLPVLSKVLSRVRRLFDLSCDPHAVYETLSSMNRIRQDVCVLGTRLPGCFDSFEMSVRAILGQQITVQAASAMAERLVNAYGVPVQTGIQGLTHVFPSPEDIVALNEPIGNCFKPLGITEVRSKAILKLAHAWMRGTVNLECCTDPQTEIKNLMTIVGIEPWAAQHIAMRAMGYTDAFPRMDCGIKQVLESFTESEISELSNAWRPWRSYAAINLWNLLDCTQKE